MKNLQLSRIAKLMGFEASVLFKISLLIFPLDFSRGLPGSGGAGPFGDESEAADEGESARQSYTTGQDLLPVSFLPRKGTFQANVPRLPLRYLRARSADGRGESIYLAALLALLLFTVICFSSTGWQTKLQRNFLQAFCASLLHIYLLHIHADTEILNSTVRLCTWNLSVAFEGGLP